MKHTSIVTSFIGLRNVQRPERIPVGAMIDCENIYIDDTGGIESIPGFELVSTKDTGIPSTGVIGEGTIGISYVVGTDQLDLFTSLLTPNISQGTIGLSTIGVDYIIGSSGTVVIGITDCWEMDHLNYGFFVINEGIYSRDSNDYNLLIKEVSDHVFSWASVADNCWYAKNDCGWIINGKKWQPLKLPLPNNPTFNVTNGTLRKGQYQVTQIFEHMESGLQGPASPSMNVQIPDNSALIIYPDIITDYKTHVFITECDGTVERYLGTSEGGIVVYDGQNLGQPVDPRQIKHYPFPNGEIIGLTWSQGRLFAATYEINRDVSTIYYSEPFHYTLWDWYHDVFQVPGKVIQLLGIDEGILIATDRSLYLREDNGTKQGLLKKLDNYGCLKGRPMDTNTWGDTFVATNRGASVYRPGKGFIEGFQKFRWQHGECFAATVDINGVTLSAVLTTDSNEPYNIYE